MKTFREWIEEEEKVEESLKKAALAAALLMGTATAKADADKPHSDSGRPAASQKENKPLIRVGDAIMGGLVGLGAAGRREGKEEVD